MLSVRLLTNTTETMASYNTLETFTLGGTHYLNSIAFGKYVYSKCFTNILVYFAIADFLNESFRGGLRFGKVIDLSFYGVLFFFITKCYLESIVAVCFNGLLLCNHAWAGFNYSNSSLLATCIEDTRHADFLTNNTFHCILFLSSALTSGER